MDVARGLEYLHSHNIVHGDLKGVSGWLSFKVGSDNNQVDGARDAGPGALWICRQYEKVFPIQKYGYICTGDDHTRGICPTDSSPDISDVLDRC